MKRFVTILLAAALTLSLAACGNKPEEAVVSERDTTSSAVAVKDDGVSSRLESSSEVNGEENKEEEAQSASSEEKQESSAPAAKDPKSPAGELPAQREPVQSKAPAASSQPSVSAPPATGGSGGVAPPASSAPSASQTPSAPPAVNRPPVVIIPPSGGSGNSSTAPESSAPPQSQQPTPPAGLDDRVRQVAALVNEERAKAGLPALTLDTTLSANATVRAREIVSKFDHTRPDGSSFSTAITIPYRRSGENIAWGQKSPEAVMNAWMGSDGHRKNILGSSFTKLGVGVVEQNGRLYWVQLFVG
jgi:uncharacterized protein YkwD